MKALDRIVRGVLVINFALFILSFIPAFSGIGQHDPGFADDLWGKYRLDGWRGDFVWVCASTLLILVASMPFIVVGGVTSNKEPRYHRTAILSLVWMACFLVYLGYMLVNML